jgi:hypothetical protein
LVGGLGPHVAPWIVVIPGVDPGPDVGVELQGDATNSTPVSTPTISTATAHLRDVLGDQTYESLARKGETMTTAAMATYPYDQIDRVRADLQRGD